MAPHGHTDSLTGLKLTACTRYGVRCWWAERSIADFQSHFLQEIL
jgi:hypothetical protein